MRAFVLVSMLVAGMSFTPQFAYAQKCPADANAASIAVWPRGAIKTGRSVTGTHPCGRRIACTGGTSNAAGSRQCRWL
jgi:hypothetical protein